MNRKWYTAYLIAAIATTLGVLQGHLSIAILFKWDVMELADQSAVPLQ